LTPAFAVPFTTAFIAVVWPAVSDFVVGLSVTDTVGMRATVALALFVGSTMLLTVKVMVC